MIIVSIIVILASWVKYAGSQDNFDKIWQN